MDHILPKIPFHKYTDSAFLFLRIGLGMMFILHGQPHLFGGPDQWEILGRTMEQLSVHLMPAFLGFIAAFGQFMGGILILLGLFFRLSCVFLAVTMLAATAYHLSRGDTFLTTSHSIELFIVFIFLTIVGPGKYALDFLLAEIWNKKHDDY